VGLVDHEPRPAAARRLAQLGQRGDVAVAGEHRLGDDHGRQRPAAGGAVQLPRHLLGVAVVVRDGLALGQPARVGQRGAGELVDEDRRAGAAERADGGDRREVAGARHQRGLRAQEAGEALLEPAVDQQRPVRLAGGAGARTPAQRRVGGGLADAGMIGQTEVVRRRQDGHRPAVEHDARTRGPAHEAHPILLIVVDACER
jgi:hypothetical protein